MRGRGRCLSDKEHEPSACQRGYALYIIRPGNEDGQEVRPVGSRSVRRGPGISVIRVNMLGDGDEERSESAPAGG